MDDCPACDAQAARDPFDPNCPDHPPVPLMHKADPRSPWLCAYDCPVKVAGFGGACRDGND